jgi:hypothetical protein
VASGRCGRGSKPSRSCSIEEAVGDDGGGHTVAATIDANFSTCRQSTTNGTPTGGSGWTAVVNGANSSGTTTAFETYGFSAVIARYVRYVTSIDNVNAIDETQIIGQ